MIVVEWDDNADGGKVLEVLLLEAAEMKNEWGVSNWLCVLYDGETMGEATAEAV